MSDLRAAPHVDAVETVRRWLSAAAGAEGTAEAPADRLAALLGTPEGVAFVTGLVDRVLRADDPRASGRELERLSRSTPGPLPWWVKGAAVLGGGFASLVPRAVGPAAHVVVRRTVGHLVVDAPREKLAAALEALAGPGVVLDACPVGRAVLGRAGADRRLAEVVDLLGRDAVARVSPVVPEVLPPAAPWAFDESGDLLEQRLAPLFARAAATPGGVVTLDAGGWQLSDLAVDVVTRLLDDPELAGLEAGVTLPASLPDSLATLRLLLDWALQRVARGGAPLRVRLEKGAPLLEEAAEGLLAGRVPPTHADRSDDDVTLLRMLDEALRPDVADAVRVGLATPDLLAVAEAVSLARSRGLDDRLEVELDLGVAPALLEAVRADVGRVVLRVPVVDGDDLAGAADHLARRVRDVAHGGPWAAGSVVPFRDPAVLGHEAARHRAAVARAEATAGDRPAGPRRAGPSVPPEAGGAGPVAPRAAVDPDPGLDRDRSRARRVLARARSSRLGVDAAAATRLDDGDALDELLSDAARAAVGWARESVASRAELLDAVADALAAARDVLAEVAVSETGATLVEADRDVSDAVDAARWAASLARDLVDVPAARPEPTRLTLVLTPGGTPFATPLAEVALALVAGGAVAWTPSRTAVRCAAVLDEVVRAAGVPGDLLVVLDLDRGGDEGRSLRRRLVEHPAVGAVRLTGPSEVVRELRSWRHDLPLTARTPGASSIVVTPAADPDRAVADVVRSACAGAGQHRSAVDHVLLVGSVATSARFRDQLVDAVRSLLPGPAHDATTQVGPLREPAAGPVLRALTTLEEGESWLVEPRRLDEGGRLWSPGLKAGVSPDRVGEHVAAPVLGIVAVASLDDAVALQSRPGARVAAGLQSLDADEVAQWAWGVSAGELSVGRATTDVATRRRPAGGRGRALVGPVVAAGGPSALAAQGTWVPLPHEPHPSLRLSGVPDVVVPVIESSRSSLSFEQFDRVRGGARSDRLARERDLGPLVELDHAVVARDVLRHRPRAVVLRLAEGGDLADLVRLVAAAAGTRSPLVVSAAVPVPSALVLTLRAGGSPVRLDDVVVESDEVFLARLGAGLLQAAAPAADDAVEMLRRAGGGPVVGGGEGAVADGEARPESDVPAPSAEGVARYRDLHVRLVGGDPRAVLRAVHGSVDVTVWSGPVTEEGRIELLPFLTEQSVGVVVHRHGVVDPALAAVRL